MKKQPDILFQRPACFFYGLNRIIIILFVFYGLAAVALGQAPPPADAGATTGTLTADPAALLYMAKCAGCHTVGGGAIGDAPDLAAVAGWPRADLQVAIDRMQKNVGPMPPAEIGQLTDLLQRPDVRALLDDARQSQMRQRQSKLAPGSAAKGQRLFMGGTPLAADGMACVACHAVQGRGGTLAIDLTDVHGRLGGTALTSSLETINFPVMKSAYATRPVTPQEVLHLVAYLELAALTEGTAPLVQKAAPHFGWAGLLLGIAMLGGMGWWQRRQDRPGVRARLVQESRRSLHQ